MSTKIYNGYRISTKRINEFLIEVSDSVLGLTAEYISDLAEHMSKSKDYQEKLAEFNREHSNQFFWAYLNMYHLSKSKNMERGIFDIESAVNLYIDGSKTYCVFYLAVPDTIIPSYAEEYSYWNNTDCPDDILSGRWNRRGKNWERVVLDNPHETKITHLFVDVRNYKIMAELEKRFYKQQKSRMIP